MQFYNFFIGSSSSLRLTGILSGLLVLASIMPMTQCSRHSTNDNKKFAGHWLATIEVGGYERDLVLHLSLVGFGQLQGTFECPQEGARGVDFEVIEFEGSKFKLWVESSGTVIEGRLDSAGTVIEGVWKQSLRERPVTFRRADSLFVTQSDYRYQPPAKLDDGWDVAGLGQVDIDSTLTTALIKTVRSGQFKNIDSIIIVRHGRLVLEEYFCDFYGRDYEHNVTTVTKSVVSALTGIALELGFINSLDEPVYSFFPGYEKNEHWSQAKNRITLRHLLTMTSGLDCSNMDPRSPGHPDRMFQSPDWIQYCLDIPMSDHEPGEQFAYCEGNAMLMGEVLRLATGLSVPAYAHKYLFTPLGIEHCYWGYTPRGKALTGTSLHLRSRDMAKFGQLYLDGGRWRGRQIVPAKWVEQSTAKRFDTGLFDGYGYFWWRERFKRGQETVDAFSAAGNGGQKITVIPELDMVVVLTAAAFDKKYVFEQTQDIMNRYILPAVR